MKLRIVVRILAVDSGALKIESPRLPGFNGRACGAGPSRVADAAADAGDGCVEETKRSSRSQRDGHHGVDVPCVTLRACYDPAITRTAVGADRPVPDAQKLKNASRMHDINDALIH